MKEPQVVLDDTSPHGNLQAIVEQDERVAYLYVRALQREDLGTRSCWLRNLAPAPEELDRDGMEEGIPPMLPREHCLHPEGMAPLDATRLEIVWFPEGDGIALLEDGKPLAVIPSWGITGDFPGYARDARGESMLGWGLSGAEAIPERVRAAITWWRNGSPWKECQDAFLAEYERVLGPRSRYFAIDGQRWPNKAMVRTDTKEGSYLLTLGISLRPQPQVELHYEDPADLRRFEFAACLVPGTDEQTIMQLARYLSGQSNLPWENLTFLGNGHTVPCDAFSEDPGLRHFTAVLLVDHPPGAPEINPLRMDGDRVMLLWVVPITEAERQLIVEERSAEFIERFPADWPLHVIAKRPVVL